MPEAPPFFPAADPGPIVAKDDPRGGPLGSPLGSPPGLPAGPGGPVPSMPLGDSIFTAGTILIGRGSPGGKPASGGGITGIFPGSPKPGTIGSGKPISIPVSSSPGSASTVPISRGGKPVSIPVKDAPAGGSVPVSRPSSPGPKPGSPSKPTTSGGGSTGGKPVGGWDEPILGGSGTMPADFPIFPGKPGPSTIPARPGSPGPLSGPVTISSSPGGGILVIPKAKPGATKVPPGGGILTDSTTGIPITVDGVFGPGGSASFPGTPPVMGRPPGTGFGPGGGFGPDFGTKPFDPGVIGTVVGGAATGAIGTAILVGVGAIGDAIFGGCGPDGCPGDSIGSGVRIVPSLPWPASTDPPGSPVDPRPGSSGDPGDVSSTPVTGGGRPASPGPSPGDSGGSPVDPAPPPSGDAPSPSGPVGTPVKGLPNTVMLPDGTFATTLSDGTVVITIGKPALPRRGTPKPRKK